MAQEPVSALSAEGVASLKGSAAIITGAGSGLGRETALRLAGEGAAVGIFTLNGDEGEQTAELVEKAGGRASCFAGDITDKDDVSRGFRQLQKQIGDVSLLVNNAASNSAYGQLWDQDPARWWHDLTVNVYGTFLCSAAILTGMVQRRAGRIINIASGTAGLAHPHNTAYASSKAAIVRMTDSLAIETAPFGVTVFALSPGSIRTAIGRSAELSEQGRHYLAEKLANIPWVSADRATEVIVYLASGKADSLSGRWFNATDDLDEAVARSADVLAGDRLQLRRLAL